MTNEEILGSFREMFGEEASSFLRLPIELVNYLERNVVQYFHMEPGRFEQLLRRDLGEGASVYWHEVIGRAHFAAVASTIRTHRWCAGMAAAHRAGLLLPFCSSFRALIEAVADTFQALHNVATGIATHRADINRCLNKQPGIFLSAGELEEQLIHFSHARRIEKGGQSPASHRAKSAAEYIQHLDGPKAIEGLREVYGVLCEYTHPAAQSVAYLQVPLSQETWAFVAAHERERIEALARKHAKTVFSLIMYGFNSAVLVFKVLQHIDVPRFHSPLVDDIDLSEIKAWRDCVIAMGLHVDGSPNSGRS